MINITILGQELEVVKRPVAGAFEPDYEAFFDELHEKSVVIFIQGVRWRLSTHEDISGPNRVIIRIKSLGNEYLDFRNYGLEFMIDREEMEYAKVDRGHLNKMVIKYFKEHPVIQKMFIDYVDELPHVKG